LPEDQGAVLELLELKQMLDKWVPRIQGLEAVITTAQGNRTKNIFCKQVNSSKKLKTT
jgi:hypothetical protein